MAMTLAPQNHLKTWLVAMAMLGSLFLSSLWVEIISARFEMKPMIPSYTAFCARAEKSDLKIFRSICRDHGSAEQSAN